MVKGGHKYKNPGVSFKGKHQETLPAAEQKLSSYARVSRLGSSLSDPSLKAIRAQFDVKETTEQARKYSDERTREWLLNSLRAEDQFPMPNLDIAETLYQSVIDALRRLQGHVARQFSGVSTDILKDALERLFLWGREYREEGLSFVLCNTSELRNTVLDGLKQIGSSLLSLIEQNSDFENPDHFQGLQSLVEQASHNLEFSLIYPGENMGSHEVHTRSLDSPVIEDLQQFPEGSFSDDGQPVCTSTGNNDNCGIIDGEVDCLMELLPSIEQSYAHLQLFQERPGASKSRAFSGSTEALPFVQHVADMFDEAETAFCNVLANQTGKDT